MEIPGNDRGQLTGRMSGDLGTDDLKGACYDLSFYLTLDGELLYGAVTAGDTPRLSFWVELKKERNERP